MGENRAEPKGPAKKKPTKPKELEWDPATPTTWADDVAKWPWQEVAPGNRWVKSGRCPRCKHEISIEVEWGVYIDQPTVLAVCRCQRPHTDRPEDAPPGCGQRAFIPGPTT
jgi:hypothetical protein